MKPTEPEPFVHETKVRWAHCDVARIAYTGQIPGFALEAIDAWWESRTGKGWYGLNLDRNFGTPFVHMSIDFRSPVTPRHMLECEVRVLRLSDRSIRFAVTGRQDGTVCFDSEFVQTFIVADSFEKCDLPAEIREAITAS